MTCRYHTKTANFTFKNPAPIPESKTQFDAFNKKEPETFVIPKQESSDNDSDSRTNSQNESKNRKIERKNKHHREKPPTFEDIFTEALRKVEFTGLNNQLWLNKRILQSLQWSP